MTDQKDTTNTNNEGVGGSAWSRLEALTQRAGLLQTFKGLVAAGLTHNPERMAKTLGVSRGELESLLNDLRRERPEIFANEK